MSAFLYDLGRSAFRSRGMVIGVWAVILMLAGGVATTFGGELDNSFSIPGSESQDAMTELSHIVPSMTGAQSQTIVIPPAGTKADAASVQTAVNAYITKVEKVDLVASVTSPYDAQATGLVNPADSAALVTAVLTVGDPQVTPGFRDSMLELTAELQADLGPGAIASVGGDAFSIDVPSIGVTELIGLLIALFVLYLTFRSFIAATMPLITAVVGVGIAMMLVTLATSFATISSSALMLAVMLGLAVGIDYSLFVLSRHRDELASGVEPEEAAARSVATAGSAVLFAALTVIIALLGLAVPGVPILTIMGLCAATAVFIAGTIAVTLTPALLGVFGDRLRPKVRTPRAKRRTDDGGKPPAQRDPHWLARGWVRTITRRPIITVLLCIGILGLAALPATQIELGLPNGGTAAEGTPQRTTYDLVAQYYGPGYNGPLLVTSDIISSTDPVGLVDDIGDYLRTVPGVASVPLATPDPTGVLAIVQVIPTTGPSDPATADLVRNLRDTAEPTIEAQDDVQIKVTGNTAVAIDVTDRLAEALIPFAVLVVGLSLILLMTVFRSIVVPVTATLGYLLSLGAALGVVTVVFVLGYGAEPLDIPAVGPVIAFLPVILMAVLFGLAMDYEVFLVSRIQERFTRTGDPRASIEVGFLSASRVVTAAALIMFGVFLSFFPEGDSTIKPMSLGLAVGVFVDAFIVRMTLMPALLLMFGRHAWWLPAGLDQRLPRLDIEGEGLHRELELADWPDPARDIVVAADGLVVAGSSGPLAPPLSLLVPRGTLTVLTGADERRLTALMMVLAGRIAPTGGNLRLVGLLVPDRAGQARRRIALLGPDELSDPASVVPVMVAADLAVVDGIDRIASPQRRAAAWHAVVAASEQGGTVVVGTAAADETPPGAEVEIVDLRHPVPDRPTTDSGDRQGALP